MNGKCQVASIAKDKDLDCKRLFWSRFEWSERRCQARPGNETATRSPSQALKRTKKRISNVLNILCSFFVFNILGLFLCCFFLFCSLLFSALFLKSRRRLPAALPFSSSLLSFSVPERFSQSFLASTRLHDFAVQFASDSQSV